MLSLLSFPTNLFLLFGLLFILATLMNFKKGLLIFLFLTPIIPMSISLYLSDSVPLITFHRVGLVVLILVWIVKYLVSEKYKIEKVPLLGLVSLFLLLVFITSVFSINPGTSMREFFSERMFGSLIVYFLVFQSIKDEKNIKRVIYILLFSGFIVSLYGIFEFFHGENLFAKIKLVPEEKLLSLGFGYQRIRSGILRIQSTFSHPLHLSSYLVFLIPIIMVLFLNSSKKLWLGIMLIIYLAAMAFTVSRGAWFILGIITLLVVRKERMLFFGLLLMSIIVGSFFYKQRLLEFFSGYTYRWWLLKGSLSAAIKHGAFGTGLRTFKEVVEVMTPRGITRTDPMCYFSKILVENGILAFAIFLTLFLKLISRTYQSSKKFQQLKCKILADLMLFSSAGIVGVLILGISSIVVLSSSAGNIIFWAFAALLVRLWLISKEERISKRKYKETDVVQN